MISSMVSTQADHIGGGPPILIITQHLPQLPQATTIIPATPATTNVYGPHPAPAPVPALPPPPPQRPNVLPVSYGPPNPLFGAEISPTCPRLYGEYSYGGPVAIRPCFSLHRVQNQANDDLHCRPTSPAVCVYHSTCTMSVCHSASCTTTSVNLGNARGMEAVWHTEFQTLFSHFFTTNSHIWYLGPVSGPPSSGCWTAFFDSAKVRFCCQDCGHGWTSMKGRVAFWFCFNSINNDGHIAFKLYGQKCQRCKTGNYENAMWYPEEVTKVMLNAYNRVGQTIYGYYQASYTKSRRPGKPRTPHNSDLCQACQDGICSERR